MADSVGLLQHKLNTWESITPDGLYSLRNLKTSLLMIGGTTWGTSDNLAQLSPYYTWYKQAAKQMSLYSYAQHVGKIIRGQFLNPEQNMPKDRAFGYQSDFNPEDLKSGAFNHKPQGQKFRATEVKSVES